MTNQNAIQNQNQIQGGNAMKVVAGFKAVNYQIEGVTDKVAQFTAAVMQGESVVAKFRYGHSVTGGRTMFLTFDGKDPVAVKKDDLYARLIKAGVQNVDTVKDAVGTLVSVHTKAYISGTCCNCGGVVDAAARCFSQRQHEALGITLKQMLCYNCSSKKWAEYNKNGKVIPATAKTIEKKEAPKKESSAPANKETRKPNREKRKSYTTEYMIPNELANEIREFAIDVDTMPVEVVQLLRSLKRVFGHSIEAAQKSSTVWAQEQYIRKAAERSEAEVAANEVSSVSEDAQAIVEQTQETVICKRCGQEGHADARSGLCPERKSKHNAKDSETEHNAEDKHNVDESIEAHQEEAGASAASPFAPDTNSERALQDEIALEWQEKLQAMEALAADGLLNQETQEAPTTKEEHNASSVEDITAKALSQIKAEGLLSQSDLIQSVLEEAVEEQCIVCDKFVPAHTINELSRLCESCHNGWSEAETEEAAAIVERSDGAKECMADSNEEEALFVCMGCWKPTPESKINVVSGKCPSCK